MSVYCQEHHDTPAAHFLQTVDEVFCVTTSTSPKLTAVCRAAIDAIPPEERSADQLQGGLDVHFGHSIPNAMPGYQANISLKGLTLGERRFSITTAAAERYLPRTARLYQPIT